MWKSWLSAVFWSINLSLYHCNLTQHYYNFDRLYYLLGILNVDYLQGLKLHEMLTFLSVQMLMLENRNNSNQRLFFVHIERNWVLEISEVRSYISMTQLGCPSSHSNLLPPLPPMLWLQQFTLRFLGRGFINVRYTHKSCWSMLCDHKTVWLWFQTQRWFQT